MKYLFIVRHSKAAYMDPQFDDFDRPLTAAGQQSITILLEQIKDISVAPDVVLCSAARRTRETLEGLRSLLSSFCRVDFDDELYAASRQALASKIHQVDDQCAALMLVGHNPGLEQLVSWLLGDDSDLSLIKTLPTCGFVKIAFDVDSWALVGPGNGVLKHYVVPDEPQ